MLLAKRRVFAAKIESVVGTAEVLAAADAAMNAFETTIQPNIDFVERAGQGGFSPIAGALGEYGATISVAFEWHFGDPTPLWASTLLPACGMLNTSGVFTPVSLAPGATGGPK